MKNNKLKSTLMLMTAIMGLSIAVPTFTSVGSDATAQADYISTNYKAKYRMDANTQLSIQYWLNDTLDDKTTTAIDGKLGAAYDGVYAKTKSKSKAMAAVWETLTKYTGVKFDSTGNYSDKAKIDKKKAATALKNSSNEKEITSAVSSIVKANSKKTTKKPAKKTTTKKKATKKSTKKAKKVAKKVYSLKATKTSKNAKKIKITGKYKGSKTTKYVHVHTYKTNNWVKLSKKRTFSVKVKANHAKHVWVYGANRKTVKHSHKKATYKYSRASKSTVATIKVVKAAANK